MEMIKKLFQLADKAKNFNEYTLANILFAYIFKNFNSLVLFQYETEEFSKECPAPKSWTGWKKYFDNYGYYDLLAMEYEGEYLCIPIPLLSMRTVKYAVKKIKKGQGRYINRLSHNRHFADGEEVSFDPILEFRKLQEEFPEFKIPRGILKRKNFILSNDLSQFRKKLAKIYK